MYKSHFFSYQAINENIWNNLILENFVLWIFTMFSPIEEKSWFLFVFSLNQSVKINTWNYTSELVFIFGEISVETSGLYISIIISWKLITIQTDSQPENLLKGWVESVG